MPKECAVYLKGTDALLLRVLYSISGERKRELIHGYTGFLSETFLVKETGGRGGCNKEGDET